MILSTSGYLYIKPRFFPLNVHLISRILPAAALKPLVLILHLTFQLSCRATGVIRQGPDHTLTKTMELLFMLRPFHTRNAQSHLLSTDRSPRITYFFYRSNAPSHLLPINRVRSLSYFFTNRMHSFIYFPQIVCSLLLTFHRLNTQSYLHFTNRIPSLPYFSQIEFPVLLNFHRSNAQSYLNFTGRIPSPTYFSQIEFPVILSF